MVLPLRLQYSCYFEGRTHGRTSHTALRSVFRLEKSDVFPPIGPFNYLVCDFQRDSSIRAEAGSTALNLVYPLSHGDTEVLATSVKEETN